MCLGLLFRLHLIPFPHDFWDIFRYQNPYLDGGHPYTVLKNSEFLGYLWAILHSIVLWHNIVMCLGLLLRLHLIPFPLDFWDIFGQQNSFLDGGHHYTELENCEFLGCLWAILHCMCIMSFLAHKSYVLGFAVYSSPSTFGTILGTRIHIQMGGHPNTELGNSEFLSCFQANLHCILSSLAHKSNVLGFVVLTSSYTIPP